MGEGGWQSTSDFAVRRLGNGRERDGAVVPTANSLGRAAQDEARGRARKHPFATEPAEQCCPSHNLTDMTYLKATAPVAVHSGQPAGIKTQVHRILHPILVIINHNGCSGG